MENPYLRLHREFRAAGAEVLISSGQACVIFGLAAFSKDGDWIIRENERSCAAVLKVLGRHAVRLLLAKASRAKVVAAIAIEQDTMIRQDRRRVDALRKRLARYARDFARLRLAWRRTGAVLSEQHRQLVAKAQVLLRPTV